MCPLALAESDPLPNGQGGVAAAGLGGTNPVLGPVAFLAIIRTRTRADCARGKFEIYSRESMAAASRSRST